MPEFYKRSGFLSTGEGDMLFLPIEGEYEAIPKTEYEPLEEDKGKAVMLYSPTCQFSYPFAKTIEEMIKKILPEIKIKIVNSWEKPKEAIKRKNWWLLVNAKPIKTLWKLKNSKKRLSGQQAKTFRKPFPSRSQTLKQGLNSIFTCIQECEGNGGESDFYLFSPFSPSLLIHYSPHVSSAKAYMFREKSPI